MQVWTLAGDSVDDDRRGAKMPKLFSIRTTFY